MRGGKKAEKKAWKKAVLKNVSTQSARGNGLTPQRIGPKPQRTVPKPRRTVLMGLKKKFWN